MSKTIVLELTDRRPSSYVRQGSEDSGLPLHLDAPSLYKVLNRSIMVDPKTGKRTPIRYIVGCETIVEAEQKAQGIDPNPLHSAVYFENGVLSVEGDGRYAPLYEFLKKCEWNESNSNRPKTAQVCFREINTELKASQQIDDLDDKSEAFAFVAGLRSKAASGGYTYDEPRIEALLAQFNLKVGDSPAEKVAALVGIAQTRPTFFMERVNSTTATVRFTVMSARDMGVIILEGDRASFKSTGEAFHKFKSKDGDTRIIELVNHFLNPKNKTDIDRLNIELEAAQKLELAEK